MSLCKLEREEEDMHIPFYHCDSLERQFVGDVKTSGFRYFTHIQHPLISGFCCRWERMGSISMSHSAVRWVFTLVFGWCELTLIPWNVVGDQDLDPGTRRFSALVLWLENVFQRLFLLLDIGHFTCFYHWKCSKLKTVKNRINHTHYRDKFKL